MYMCVLVCLHPFTISQCPTRAWQTPLSAPPLCQGVYLVSVSAILSRVHTMATHVHETCPPPLEMNLFSAETLPPMSSPFNPYNSISVSYSGVALISRQHNERRDGGGSSGVWMALACVMFERAAVLFSPV